MNLINGEWRMNYVASYRDWLLYSFWSLLRQNLMSISKEKMESIWEKNYLISQLLIKPILLINESSNTIISKTRYSLTLDHDYLIQIKIKNFLSQININLHNHCKKLCIIANYVFNFYTFKLYWQVSHKKLFFSYLVLLWELLCWSHRLLLS